MSTSKAHSRQPLNNRQRSILISFYEQNPYPSANERQQLAQMTGRTLKQIQDWFSNRRRNDQKLVSGKIVSTALPMPVSPMPIQPIYYYPPIPPSTSNICPCCHLTQSCSQADQSFYSGCTTFYYGPTDNNFYL